MPNNIYYDDVKIMKKPIKNKVKKIFKLFVFLLLSISSFFFASFLSGTITVKNVSSFFIYGDNKIKLKEKTLYMVALGKFVKYEDAEKVGIGSMVRGGSGYIWIDESYYVVGNIYKDLRSAELVLNNIKDSKYNSFIKEINFPKKTLLFNDYENYDVCEIENAINLFSSLYLQMYDYSIKFDKSEMNNLAISSKVSQLKGNVKKEIIKLQNLISKKTNKKIQMILDGLISTEEILEKTILQTIDGKATNYILKNSLVGICRIEYDIVKNI